MINVLLYCSYSGSAVGYQQAIVDEAAKTVRRPREGEVPRLVGQIWTHGGARAAAGCVRGNAYFLIKRMDYQDKDKQQDEQGRKVYMNCAFTGNDRTELQYLADGFLSCYKAAVQALGDLLVIDDTEIGYTIQDLDGLHRLLASCVAAGRRLPSSRTGALEGAISFVALEGDWSYFTAQNDIPALPRPKTMLAASAYQQMLAEGLETFPPPEPAIPASKPVAATPAAEEDPAPVRAAALAETASSSEPEAPKKRAASERPASKQESPTLPPDLEERVTGMFRGELAQERTRTQNVQQKLFAQNERMEKELKKQKLWLKVALAVSAAAVLLSLILHNWGGGR